MKLGKHAYKKEDKQSNKYHENLPLTDCSQQLNYEGDRLGSAPFRSWTRWAHLKLLDLLHNVVKFWSAHIIIRCYISLELFKELCVGFLAVDIIIAFYSFEYKNTNSDVNKPDQEQNQKVVRFSWHDFGFVIRLREDHAPLSLARDLLLWQCDNYIVTLVIHSYQILISKLSSVWLRSNRHI